VLVDALQMVAENVIGGPDAVIASEKHRATRVHRFGRNEESDRPSTVRAIAM
jgi:hypothetical protein